MEPDQNEPIEKAARSPAADGRRPQSNTAAAAEELRQFLAEMRGKSPREVLGAVAESGLARGMITSAIGALVIIVVFTVGPFLLKKIPADTAPSATTGPRTEAARAEPKSTQAAARKEPAGTESHLEGDALQKSPLEEADIEKASEAMGIGETKVADPKKNPLDRKLDSLLDGSR